MSNAGESRHDLLNWINQLLQLSITKIEHLGTGAVYCQIMDSIFGDVPLQKVKFNANQEFQYVQNFKVLQGVFSKHCIDNAIPVERLIKLKFQDNLEFTQWMKRYWDMSGGIHIMNQYDALARRSGAAVAPPGPLSQTKNSASYSPSSPRRTTQMGNIPDSSSGSISSGANRMSPSSLIGGMATISISNGSTSGHEAKSTSNPKYSPRSSITTTQASMGSSDRIKELNTVIAEMKTTLESMEKERDFYFSKLRELEVLIQTHDEDCSKDDLVKQIQTILYNDGNE